MHPSSDPSRSQNPLADVVLGDPLGHGTTSSVYRARRGSAAIAVKVMHARPDDPGRQRLYAREAAVLGNLRHPALAEIYAVGTIDGRPAMAMELVEGQTLHERLERSGPLPEAQALELCRQIAEALQLAHEAGVVHRDIKPANLMLRPSGQAKLIDFGLAARAGTVQSRDATIGTVRYSPPEQTGLLGRAVDGRSDLYALGATIFEALTGRPPFEAQDVGELARLHAVAEPPDPRATVPGLSAACAAVLQRLLAKDPDDRYQLAAGLAHDLELLAAGRLSPATLGSQDHPASIAPSTPLVGRRREMRDLAREWSEVELGRGRGVVLEELTEADAVDCWQSSSQANPATRSIWWSSPRRGMRRLRRWRAPSSTGSRGCAPLTPCRAPAPSAPCARPLMPQARRSCIFHRSWPTSAAIDQSAPPPAPSSEHEPSPASSRRSPRTTAQASCG